MQRLNQQINFEGQIEKITMMDLRSRPGEVMTAVSYGKTYLIQRNGQTLAVLSKPPGNTLTMVVNGKGEIDYKV